jgi:hypothetical protein
LSTGMGWGRQLAQVTLKFSRSSFAQVLVPMLLLTV